MLNYYQHIIHGDGVYGSACKLASVHLFLFLFSPLDLLYVQGTNELREFGMVSAL
jgi:hypothetical protein